MTADMLNLTQQVATSHWGWTIALFLWLVGLSGMSLTLNFWLRSKKVLLLSTVAGVAGTLLVVSHLTRLLNLPFAAINALMEGSLNFGSWMFIGICILAVLCIVTVIESLLVIAAQKKEPGNEYETFLESDIVAWLNAILGVAATAYSGFLLTQAAGVALWNTAALPVLWILSGLACAFGLVEMLESAKKLDVHAPRGLTTAADVAHIAEALVLFAFVQSAFSGTPGAVASAEALVSGEQATLFWGGAVFVGIVVPLVMNRIGKSLPNLGLITGVASIVGALALRAAILFAGYFDPVLL